MYKLQSYFRERKNPAGIFSVLRGLNDKTVFLQIYTAFYSSKIIRNSHNQFLLYYILLGSATTMTLTFDDTPRRIIACNNVYILFVRIDRTFSRLTRRNRENNESTKSVVYPASSDSR